MRIMPSNPAIFHEAILRDDAKTIQELRSQGYQPVAVDKNGDSPMDVLSKRQDISADTRQKLHHSLLSSLNPTAPKGYVKPEAFHGSPWGFEILRSAALKAGVNDPKGGSQSLEGKVFFSDRTPLSAGDAETRNKLRQSARVYALGAGSKLTTVETRSEIYLLARAVNRAYERNAFPDSPKIALLLPSADNPEEAVYLSLLRHLAAHGALTHEKSDGQMLAKFPFPANVTVKDSSVTFSSEHVSAMMRQAFERIERELLDGKLPYLNALNEGNGVPIVFGFSKIENMQTHQIRNKLLNKVSQYSYQSADHPLSGSPSGGKLKEIEVKSRRDLATLMLACIAKNVPLPDNTLIRISPSPRDKQNSGVKAQYLDGAVVEQFRRDLMNGREKSDIASLGLNELQALNRQWRASAEKMDSQTSGSHS
ncbi:hypothetical protein [Brenneria izbisi]|uniref:Uncharacterized protein n=1 Tax=Brenneria izbisi TaxID=2939450 RepID=A0AA41XXL8_9GAMM|nr:hypothetical protein [Brenneria izbisi]MCV9879304.1 hypothetical protein [Brenneria izbisi]MCV9883860.1 hypothetical protein [Brenneria izbisi]